MMIYSRAKKTRVGTREEREAPLPPHNAFSWPAAPHCRGLARSEEARLDRVRADLDHRADRQAVAADSLSESVTSAMRCGSRKQKTRVCRANSGQRLHVPRMILIGTL